VTLELLWEEGGAAGERALPGALQELYAGGLSFDGPTVYANFVETLDGVVAVAELERSNALIAGGSDDDRFVMGLLRALADVVLIGAGTLRASPQGRWRPEGVFPSAKGAFAELRVQRGLSERPAVAVVTGGVSLDVSHPALADGGVVLTTVGGAESLAGTVADVVAVNDGARVDLRAALAVLRARGHERVLVEAGPTTFAALVADLLVDELFLTVSPVIAGRRGAGRPGLVEGVELLPDMHVAPALLSLRRGGDHLFARYRF
jgi:riboflavin biosynthesis pyrimidine reductase